MAVEGPAHVTGSRESGFSFWSVVACKHIKTFAQEADRRCLNLSGTVACVFCRKYDVPIEVRGDRHALSATGHLKICSAQAGDPEDCHICGVQKHLKRKKA